MPVSHLIFIIDRLAKTNLDCLSKIIVRECVCMKEKKSDIYGIESI